VDRDALTDWLDLTALALTALGLGGLAGGWLIGPTALGVGLWLLVTGLAALAGSVLIGWHNDPQRAPSWWPGVRRAGGGPRP
jgi:hypothetical protein